MSFKAPEKYRIGKREHAILGSNISDGNNGAFKVALSGRSEAFCIASDGAGWEHVSIHIVSDGVMKTPTWSQMCKIKDLFWGDEDCVIQYHPPKSEYVNNHPHTLHLWRPTTQQIPLPPSIMVGLKELNQ